MTADYDIIMVALPRWDGAYASTAYSLARELSKYTRVFYIDNPYTYKDYWRARHTAPLQRRRNALRAGKDIFHAPDERYPQLTVVTPRLTWPINWLPPGALYEALARVNDGIVYKAIEETIRTYKLTRYVYINSFNPLVGQYFSPFFKPLLTIYHSVDDISKSAYVSRHGTRLEAEMIRRADATVVTSTELRKQKSKLSAHVYFLPNAADTVLFQRAVFDALPVPDELKGIYGHKKIICYTGNICHRLDYDLLLKIAQAHPDKVLLMVGPLSKDTYKEAGLDKMPQVLFTGGKPLEALPAYLKYSDCCIIPFRLIELTRSIYPLKINEYLSAGKPVITTKFSEDITTFEEVAFVCSSHEAFLEAIDRSLTLNDDASVQKRVRFSSANNWAARAATFLEIIANRLQHGPGRRD